MKGMNIYFCGMIGSGKTSIGKGLAKELGLPYYDLDWEMDSILGYSFHMQGIAELSGDLTDPIEFLVREITSSWAAIWNTESAEV